MPSPSASSGKKSFAGAALRHLFGLLICFGLPALVTAIAPVSWLTFQRSGDQVVAQAKTCLLFIVPFRTATVSPVASVGDRTVTGPTTYERRPGQRDRERTPETEGFLAIHGPNQTAEVQVTPANLQAVEGKVNAFLQNPNASELKLFVVANWKFSVVAGGLVSLLAVFYLLGLLVAIFRQVLRLLGAGEMRIPANP